MILPMSLVAALAATFTFSPGAPAPGQDVQFESTSPDSPAIAWDLDNDGAFDDAEGKRAKRAFAAGAHVVRMRARYDGAGESVAAQTVQVGAAAETPTPTPTATATATATAEPAPVNQPPVARIASGCAPNAVCSGLIAREGEPHTFDATPSHDADGTIARYEWDLDGIAGFEQSTQTPTLTHTFERHQLVDTMKRPLKLRVTDTQGATAETTLPLTLLERSCKTPVPLGRIKATGVCLRRH